MAVSVPCLAVTWTTLKKTWYDLVVYCSQVISYCQTYHNTSTHTHNHHLTRGPSVDCSADTVRIVVADFLILGVSFGKFLDPGTVVFSEGHVNSLPLIRPILPSKTIAGSLFRAAIHSELSRNSVSSHYTEMINFRWKL